MQKLACIFCFYLLLITCLPCADNDATIVVENATISPSQHNDHKEKNDEHCSPFCHCSCCQTVCVAKVSSHVIVESFKKIKLQEQLISSPLTDKFSSIWQPPKIG